MPKQKLTIYLQTPKAKIAFAITCPYCFHVWGSDTKDNLCPNCNGIFDDSEFQERLLSFHLVKGEGALQYTFAPKKNEQLGLF